MQIYGKYSALAASLALMITSAAHAETQTLLNLNFNSGADSLGNNQGTLVFNGIGGLQVIFTDDDSDGNFGGQADGVHITNQNLGNIKVGSSDLVLGAYDDPRSNTSRHHSSGIVATFSYGVELVRFLDTDDDRTQKTLFAFDENGALIGQTIASSQVTFEIDTSITGGQLIHKIEFDTAAGAIGGSTDSTYFTIDDFYVEGTPPDTDPPPVSNCTDTVAIYSLADRTVTFDTLAMELYNPITDEPNGQFALFTGADMHLKALPGFYDFRYQGGEPSYANKIVAEADNCYPTYSAQQETVYFPKVEIPLVGVLPSGGLVSGPAACYEALLKRATTQGDVFSLQKVTEIGC